MRCRKAKQLICLYLAPDESYLDLQDRRDLEAHLAACDSCRRDWEETAKGIALFQKYWHISPDTQTLIDRAKEREAAGLPVDPFWRFRQLIEIGIPASAVAACLAVLVLGWWVLSKPLWPVPPVGPIAASEVEKPLTIESASGEVITSGAIIQTQARQINRLTLNGRHTVSMNADTRLSIEPFVVMGQIGCQVNLAQGEVYVCVRPDGAPFVVCSSHARVIVTGTVFHVRVTSRETTLVVIEGSVRFESSRSMVSVNTGQKSIASAQFGPSKPVHCEAEKAVAWLSEREYTSLPADSRSGLGPDKLLELPSPIFRSVNPPDLESIQFDRWVDARLTWFLRQFPWAFQVRQRVIAENASAAASVPGYADVLLQSEDLWQIVYPQRADRIIPVMTLKSLLTSAGRYQIDKGWAMQVLRSARPEHLCDETMVFGLAAFDAWLQDCQFVLSGTCDSRSEVEALYEHSFAMAEYLENTRTLLWLCLRNDRSPGLSEKERTQVLDLLHKQVGAADHCRQMTLRLIMEGDPVWEACLRKLVDLIQESREYEERMANVFGANSWWSGSGGVSRVGRDDQRGKTAAGTGK